jgi:hypothetical protein
VWTSGGDPDPGRPARGHTLVRFVFLRLLGLVYLAAFLSLWPQVGGLIGSKGILPIATFLPRVEAQIGVERYFVLPTLLWIDSSDASLRGLCGLGALFSCALIAGLAPLLSALSCWILYLSLVTAGGVFLGYQWDSLLLETGLLAVLFSPTRLRSRLSQEAPPSPLVLWLFRFLLFRLTFSSGVVKLLSRDKAWRSLTALCVHYETQPLPTWVGWYAHQMPAWFQKASTLMVFALELVVPWFIFAPRRLRFAACGALVFFQLLIAGTGNYAFFNLLTIALCVLLLDDGVVPASFRERHLREVPGPRPPRVVPIVATALVLPLSLVPFFGTVGLGGLLPGPLIELHGLVQPFCSINSYGLFAIMTTSRREIQVEGSLDGKTWIPYEFLWKPGDPRHAPAFVAPHQPRLDWQMWFAALGEPQDSPWLFAFLLKLVDGSPPVVALLARDPFPGTHPLFIRARLYEYRFTDLRAHFREGTWWRREYVSAFGPEVPWEPARGP